MNGKETNSPQRIKSCSAFDERCGPGEEINIAAASVAFAGAFQDGGDKRFHGLSDSELRVMLAVFQSDTAKAPRWLRPALSRGGAPWPARRCCARLAGLALTMGFVVLALDLPPPLPRVPEQGAMERRPPVDARPSKVAAVLDEHYVAVTPADGIAAGALEIRPTMGQRGARGRREPERKAGKPVERRVHTLQAVGLRAQPRFGAPKQSDLEAGAPLVVLGQQGQWLKVRSESRGTIGYVRREFLGMSGSG